MQIGLDQFTSWTIGPGTRGRSWTASEIWATRANHTKALAASDEGEGQDSPKRRFADVWTLNPSLCHQRGRVCWAASELSGGSFGSTFVEADADVHGGPLWDFDFGRLASARPRAARRGPPPALRDHGLCSPSPWRGRLTVRETSDGMNLPGSLGRSPGAIQWIVIR